MTRLNLPQTCLLDVSGELGKKARAQLHEHIAKFPAALVEYELIKGQFQTLRSLPQPVLSNDARRQMASSIKQGVHQKLRRQQQQARARKRAALVYRLMAGVSAVAAAAVIAMGLLLVQRQIETNRRENLARDERLKQQETLAVAEGLRDYFNSTAENMTDNAIAQVASDIRMAEIMQTRLNTSENSTPKAVLLLVDSLDNPVDSDSTLDDSI